MTDHTEAEIVDNAADSSRGESPSGALATNYWIVIDAQDHRAIVVPGRRTEPNPRRLHRPRRPSCRRDAHPWDHVLARPAIADAIGVDVLAHPDDPPVGAHEYTLLPGGPGLAGRPLSDFPTIGAPSGLRSR